VAQAGLPAAYLRLGSTSVEAFERFGADQQRVLEGAAVGQVHFDAARAWPMQISSSITGRAV
jgi:hypothetical protein